MIVRTLNNGHRVTDLVEEINVIEHQFGFVNALNLFESRGTSQDAIIFDVNRHNITLIPEVARKSHQKTYGKDRTSDTYPLKLTYFKHGDRITADDLLGYRQPGREEAETLNHARMVKMADMRMAAEQTTEYLKIQALKGVMKNPQGEVVADMFNLLDVTQEVVDFDLGNPNTAMEQHFADLKKAINSGLKAGVAAGAPMVIVDEAFFIALISHPKIISAYQSYQNAGVQNLRDDLTTYYEWGASDMFTHRGITFVSYNPEFNLPDLDGAGDEVITEKAFGDKEGIAFPRNVRDMFRGYHGPSNKVSLAGEVGREMYLWEWADQRDEFYDLELEMAPLYFATRPASLVKVISST